MAEKRKQLPFKPKGAPDLKRRCYASKAFDYKSDQEICWAVQKMTGSVVEVDPFLLNMVQSIDLKRFQSNILKSLLSLCPVKFSSVQEMKGAAFMVPKKRYRIGEDLKNKVPFAVRRFKQHWNVKRVLNLIIKRCVVHAKNKQWLDEQRELLYKHVLYVFKSEDSLQFFFLNFVDDIFKYHLTRWQQHEFKMLLWKIVRNDCHNDIGYKDIVPTIIKRNHGSEKLKGNDRE